MRASKVEFVGEWGEGCVCMEPDSPPSKQFLLTKMRLSTSYKVQIQVAGSSPFSSWSPHILTPFLAQTLTVSPPSGSDPHSLTPFLAQTLTVSPPFWLRPSHSHPLSGSDHHSITSFLAQTLTVSLPFWLRPSQSHPLSGSDPNSKHWFTTSFLQPLPYLVTP